ncbi:MAG: biopolymer transporter ExbB, partial [Gammaproteobacteria bacterium]|nr:biopolymer transporter ExbB [Gammaproteobacteria bacterium]
MKKLIVILSLAVITTPASAQSLDELLQEVRQSRQQVSTEVEARLRQFRQQRDQQAALLRDVQSQLAAAEARSAELSAAFEANELQLEE